MPLLTIETAYETVPEGAHQAKFVAWETVDTKNGTEKAFRWSFETDTGKRISDLTDAGRPTKDNKLGRFVAGLIGKAPEPGMQADPESHLGKRYLVIVGRNKAGNPAITTFTPLP